MDYTGKDKNLWGEDWLEENIGDLAKGGNDLCEDWNDERIQETRTAAEGGDAEAQCVLGTIYMVGADNLGIERNRATAFEWTKKAADQNDPTADFLYGWNLFYGSAYVKQDCDSGIEYIKASAERGFVKAQKVLSLLYVSRYGDLGQGLVWAKTAAESGDLTALRCCAGVLCSIREKKEDGIRILKECARHGDKKAETVLKRISGRE